MANASEEVINSTLSSLIMFMDCLKENPFIYIFLYFVKLVCAILGTVAHLWCFRFYLCGTVSKFTSTHVFFLNHNIVEFMYCLQCVPEILNLFVFGNTLLYKVLFFFFGLSWIGRPLLQTCICIELYLAVLHPLTFLKYKDIKYRIVVVAASWFVAFGYGLYTINLQTFPDPFFTFVFFTALTVISFCCVSVLYALKQSHKRVNNQTSRYVGNRQTRNVFSTILSALLIILLTYFPQVLLSFLIIIDIDQKLFWCDIIPFISSLNSWSVMITPLLKIYKDGHLKFFWWLGTSNKLSTCASFKFYLRNSTILVHYYTVTDYECKYSLHYLNNSESFIHCIQNIMSYDFF